jgi:lipopolysaccharide/colanic/teichoic acid biosynthesis glycosyltransferase
MFLDERSFRFELARERTRVDRSRSPLALLVIELPTDRATARDLEFLGRSLIRRIRITDSIGILSERRIGVLLPDTPKSGAWKVASDICDKYPVGLDRPNCDVFVYPDDGIHRRNGEAGREAHAVDAPAEAFDALLVTPTPGWKRTIDVLGAIVGLIVSAPLLAIIAVAVKLTSRGPIIYSQEREGLGGRRFRMYKIRTMLHGAENHQEALRAFSVQDGPAFKMRDDPRTTRVGRWLRAASLDELPQFWNVLRGEMSLVGPRPLPTGESRNCATWQRERLFVVPGITCVWQVWGRSSVSFDQWMRMDLQYVRRRSLAYDMGLLLTTFPALVFQRGPR